MIKHLELNKTGSLIYADMGMTQYLKKIIEDTHLAGNEITSCIIHLISKTTCSVEFITENSLKVEFKDVPLRNKLKNTADLDSKVIIFSLNYFTRAGGESNEFIKPDSFPMIEVIIKSNLAISS